MGLNIDYIYVKEALESLEKLFLKYNRDEDEEEKVEFADEILDFVKKMKDNWGIKIKKREMEEEEKYKKKKLDEKKKVDEILKKLSGEEANTLLFYYLKQK